MRLSPQAETSGTPLTRKPKRYGGPCLPAQPKATTRLARTGKRHSGTTRFKPAGRNSLAQRVSAGNYVTPEESPEGAKANEPGTPPTCPLLVQPEKRAPIISPDGLGPTASVIPRNMNRKVLAIDGARLSFIALKNPGSNLRRIPSSVSVAPPGLSSVGLSSQRLRAGLMNSVAPRLLGTPSAPHHRSGTLTLQRSITFDRSNHDSSDQSRLTINHDTDQSRFRDQSRFTDQSRFSDG